MACNFWKRSAILSIQCTNMSLNCSQTLPSLQEEFKKFLLCICHVSASNPIIFKPCLENLCCWVVVFFESLTRFFREMRKLPQRNLCHSFQSPLKCISCNHTFNWNGKMLRSYSTAPSKLSTSQDVQHQQKL